MNEYFTSISCLQHIPDSLPDFLPRTDVIFNDINISEDEVKDSIMILQLNKASGSDGISNRLLKGVSMSICNPLAYLFNLSLNESCFPSCWKDANVIPPFKKGESNLPNNYRPVSLLSCIGKPMEHIIFKHMYNFLLVHNLIYKYQSGFQPGHSTVYQLIEI